MRMQDLVKQHSEFIGFPAEPNVEKSKEKEVTDSEDEEEVKNDAEGTEDDEPRIEEVKELSHEWEQFNTNEPLWMHKTGNAANQEHASFCKSLSNEWDVLTAGLLDIVGRITVDSERVSEDRSVPQLKEFDSKKLMSTSKEGLDPEDKVTVEKVKEVSHEWEQLHTHGPLWMRKSEEATHAEYASFYRSFSNEWEDHMAVKHFRVEGLFRALLYVPRRAHFGVPQSRRKRNNIKLYVSRVPITDDCGELVPEWLNFVAGAVDLEDLPPNNSRETLQMHKMLRMLKKNLVKQCLEMLADIAETKDDYKQFYEQFGKCLKLGVHEDTIYRTTVVKLMRYHTLKSRDEIMSPTGYVDRMVEGQRDIYTTWEKVAPVSSSLEPSAKMSMTEFWHLCVSLSQSSPSSWSNVAGRAAMGPPCLPGLAEDGLMVWDLEYACLQGASQRYRLRILHEIFDEWAVEVTIARYSERAALESFG